MRRKFLFCLLLIISCICLAVGISACVPGNSPSDSGSDLSSDSTQTAEHTHSTEFVEAVAATCTEDGHYAYWYCQECGGYFLDKNGKTLATYEDIAIKASGHTPSEWIILAEGNCTEERRMRKVCEVCGEEIETVSFTTNSHVYGEWKVIKEATCTEEGERHILCTKCGKELAVEAIPKAEHTIGEWKVIKEPTCTQKGEKQALCAICGEVAATDYIDKTEHSFAWETTKEATCTEDGEEHFICTVCRTEYKVQTINAKGHTSGEWIVTKEPTCSEYGSEHKLCEVCGVETYVTAIPKLAHTAGEYTYDRYWHYCTCTVCDENISAKHSFEDGVCTVCGYTADYSVGLTYSSSADKTEYYLTGIGTCADTEIIIPDEYLGKPVTAITDRALYNNQNITSVTIPASVKTIGFVSTSYFDYAFMDCTSLTAVYITDLEAWYNITFTSRYNNPLYYAGNLYLNGVLVENLSVPDSVTQINNYVFAGCTSVTSVTVSGNVQSIGEYSFYGCANLKEVYFAGTEEQWAALIADIADCPILRAAVYYI